MRKPHRSGFWQKRILRCDKRWLKVTKSLTLTAAMTCNFHVLKILLRLLGGKQRKILEQLSLELRQQLCVTQWQSAAYDQEIVGSNPAQRWVLYSLLYLSITISLQCVPKHVPRGGETQLIFPLGANKLNGNKINKITFPDPLESTICRVRKKKILTADLSRSPSIALLQSVLRVISYHFLLLENDILLQTTRTLSGPAPDSDSHWFKFQALTVTRSQS